MSNSAHVLVTGLIGEQRLSLLLLDVPVFDLSDSHVEEAVVAVACLYWHKAGKTDIAHVADAMQNFYQTRKGFAFHNADVTSAKFMPENRTSDVAEPNEVQDALDEIVASCTEFLHSLGTTEAEMETRMFSQLDDMLKPDADDFKKQVQAVHSKRRGRSLIARLLGKK